MGQTDEVTLSHDSERDVLYAKVAGASLDHAIDAPSGDWAFVPNVDTAGNVTGVIIMYATDRSLPWADSDDMNVLPMNVRKAIDRWYEARRHAR